MSTATGLAAAIKKEFGLEATIRKGPVGLFDIYADEAIIYSNRREGGRLPEEEEIVRRIRDYRSRSAGPAGETGKKVRGKGAEAQAASGGECGCG